MADNSLKDLTSAVYKIAENSPKIQKDVKDIRDAICGANGILSALLSIAENVEKSQKNIMEKAIEGGSKKGGDFAKANKDLTKNTGDMVDILKKMLDQLKKGVGGSGGGVSTRGLGADNFKNNSKEVGKQLGGINTAISLVGNLKNIKLKDFLFANIKLKALKSLMSKAIKISKKFKNDKEIDNTVNFVNASIKVAKTLSLISKIRRSAQRGEKALEKIFLGDKKRGGLLKLFRKMLLHKKAIKDGKKGAKRMEAACSSLLIATLCLSAIAILAIPAAIGALCLKFIMPLLISAFKGVNKGAKHIVKGSVVLLIMSASVIAFSLGLLIMSKAVENMSFAGVGIMLASIVGLGLAFVGLGFGAMYIAPGAATLLLMGLALGVFALTVLIWKNIDPKKAMQNIDLAVGGLRETFGLELGKGDETKSAGSRLGGGLMDIAMAVLNFGKTFFVMGSLLLAGAALGLLYVGLKPWQNFDGKKSADNIKTAVAALKEAFGLEDSSKDGSGGGSKLKGQLLDIAVALLQMGKTFITMGTLVVATAMMDIIRLTLIPWEKYDGKKSAANMKIAIGALKETFGLDQEGENVKSASSLKGQLLDIAVALLQMGKTFITIGTLTVATAMMDIIRLTLIPWESYDASKPAANMKIAIDALKDCFGLKEEPDSTVTPGTLAGEILDMGVSLLQMGNTFIKIGTLVIATAMMDIIRLTLMPWESYDASKPAANMKIAIGALNECFGIKEPPDSVTTAGAIAGEILDLGLAILQMGKTFVTMGTLVIATAMMDIIRLTLIPWENYNAKKSTGNMKIAINCLKSVFGLEEKSGIAKLGSLFGDILDIGTALLQAGKTFITMGTLVVATAMAGLILKNLKPWDNYDGRKGAANMGASVNALKKAFGLEEKKDESIWDKIKSFGGGILDIGTALLQAGKTFITMGTLVVATGMAGLIRENLKPWDNYSGAKASANMSIAVNSLKSAFGIGDAIGSERIGSLSLGGSILQIGTSLLQSGKTLVMMGTLVIATAMMDIIRLTLAPWEDYDGAQASKNMGVAVSGLKSAFGLDGDNSGIGNIKSVGGISSDLFEFGQTLLQSGKVFVQMGTILMATATMDKIKKNLLAWDDFDPTKSISNIDNTVRGLKKVFGLTDEIAKNEEQAENKSVWGKIGGFFKKAAEVATAPVRMASNMIDAAENLTEGGKIFASLNNLIKGSAIMLNVLGSIKPWDTFNPDKSISNMSYTMSSLESLFFNSNMMNFNTRKFKNLTKVMDKAGSLFKTMSKTRIMSTFSFSIMRSARAVNSIDLEKAIVMRDIFTSFGHINKYNTFDKFTESVNKFVEACNEMVDALDNFESRNPFFTIPAEGNQESQVDNPNTNRNTSGATPNNINDITNAIVNAIRQISLTANVDASFNVGYMDGDKIIISIDN